MTKVNVACTSIQHVTQYIPEIQNKIQSEWVPNGKFKSHFVTQEDILFFKKKSYKPFQIQLYHINRNGAAILEICKC